LTIGCAGVLLALWSCSPGKRSAGREKSNRTLDIGDVIVKVERMPECDTRLGEVVGVIEAPRERVWSVISDYNEHKHFMPNILECFAIRPEALELLQGASPQDLGRLEGQLRQYHTDRITDTVVYIYGMGDFPWPMPNKRYILKVVRDPLRYVTHSTMVIGQMKVNESWWELERYGSDGSRTLARYRIFLDPGIPLPEFAIGMATRSTLPKVIQAVRERVKNPAYKNPGKGEDKAS
jgi:hypothetical protein